MKTIALGDVFTDEQLAALRTLWDTDREHFHKRALVEVVTPAMDQINEKTGQANDAGYMAYMVEAVFTRYC